MGKMKTPKQFLAPGWTLVELLLAIGIIWPSGVASIPNGSNPLGTA